MHFLADWPGSFTCHCRNTAVERTPNKGQHRKFTLEKKFSSRFCRDSNSQTFDHESGTLATSYPGSPVERTIKTETDTKTEINNKNEKKKEWAISAGLCQRQKQQKNRDKNRNIPTT